MRLFVLFCFLLTSVLAFGQKILPSFSELDSVDVKIRGKGTGKTTAITYVSYVKTAYGVDTIRRKSPALDSLQSIEAAKEAFDNALRYYQRAADATFNVWQQIQLAKALNTSQKLFKTLSKEGYESVTWSAFGKQFVGNWQVVVSDTEFTNISVELDGTVKVLSGTPRNKPAIPKFDVLADVRVVVSNVVQGKPIVFDFVGQGLYWSLATGYYLQRMP